MEQEHWERKYHLALERMERDERDFRVLEEGLRRLVLRLAALARGQGDEADRLLDRLGDGLRQASSPEALDPLLDELADAVAHLDRSARPLPDDALDHPDPPGVEALRVILQRIVLLPAFTERGDRLRAALAEVRDAQGTAILAGQLADLVNHQREALRTDIVKLQDLLGEVSGRLGEMTRYLDGELEGRNAGAVEGRGLDSSVREEIRLLGEHTRDAVDLGTLQRQVESRLEMIDRHFKAYRSREDARLAAYRDRAERMRDRVEELETQATTLQDSLRREHELALTDPLTGLPNRLAYERRIAQSEQALRDAGTPFCIGAFDIDHFKTINDSFGHAAGDAVLRIVGQALTGRATPRDVFVARYGGEEFVAIFDAVDQAEAMRIAEDLCRIVEGLAFHAKSRPVKVTMSGGVARFDATDTVDSVFERADRALYTAKRAGRNRCEAL
ncbi:diguanylate cyclase [Luteibacter rhizovicinus]|uniref:diguanylate cyclase n=1 Tax=Luteibacter rhizovicinus TaxID=242606 RepID=A0A4R3YHU7_9GAMM|nr:GGDEF domain-containing protein [Luteibacter rhizovicinus]TCV91651.1 diguanylate cyclase [Luteibacter rhizovicinus]